MDYLKRYRQEAGLVRSNENATVTQKAHQNVTPTKQTLLYLRDSTNAGASQHQATKNHFQMQKTPARQKNSGHKTPSAVKDTQMNRNNSYRQSKPFTRVDQNMAQSSSRKSIKQTSAHSNKGQTVVHETQSSSFRIQSSSTSPYTGRPSNVVAESTLNGFDSKRYQAAATNVTSRYAAAQVPPTTNKRVPTKSASSVGNSGQTSAKPRQTATTANGRKTPQNLFSTSNKSLMTQAAGGLIQLQPQSQSTTHMLNQPKEHYQSQASSSGIFSKQQQAVVTPKNHGKGKPKIADGRLKTPHEGEKIQAVTPSQSNYNSQTLHTRKKSVTQQSTSKKRTTTATKRRDSPISETASEKAVKDAMMKTTQKIYFPNAFKMPGNKKDLKKEQEATEEYEQEQEHSAFVSVSAVQEQQEYRVSRATNIKPTFVNLDSDNQSSEFLSPSIAYGRKQNRQSLNSKYHKQAATIDNQTFCEQLSRGAHGGIDDLTHDSIVSMDESKMMETQTNKSGGNVSKLSGGTRRSRKDRSGLRKPTNGRNAITPHVFCTLKGTNEDYGRSQFSVSVHQQPEETTTQPQVRILPGSETISLELDIKGMTQPNKTFTQDDPESDGEKKTTVASTQKQQSTHKKNLSKTGSLPNAMQRQGVSPMSRNLARGTLQAPTTFGNNGHAADFRGALNAYVQSSTTKAIGTTRSRTPLITSAIEPAHQQQLPQQLTSTSNTLVEKQSRLAEKIMQPVQLNNTTPVSAAHKKNASSNNAVLGTQPVTPSKQQINCRITPDRRQQYSAMRSTTMPNTAEATTPLTKKSQQARLGNNYGRSQLTNLTPLRQNTANTVVAPTSTVAKDQTPRRSNIISNTGHTNAFERSRYSNVTQTVDRASESLEKINEVFRQISVGTFDKVSMVRRPQKEEIEGCIIFCRFVNAFRAAAEQWEPSSLQTWSSLQSFMLYSPNCQKICLEVQQIKKKVLRPHISRVLPHTYDGLQVLREQLMRDLNERTVNFLFKNNQAISKLVMLVYVSVNHLLPTPPVEEEQEVERKQENDQNLDENDEIVSENHEVTQEEIIDLQNDNSGLEEEQQKCWAEAAPQPEKTNAYQSGCHSHREQFVHEDQSYEAISYVNNAKVNETTIVDPKDHEAGQNFNQGDEPEKHSSHEAQVRANQDKDEAQDCQEEVDVESSRGSAWPSETSRLTPHQSTYQMNNMMQHHTLNLVQQPQLPHHQILPIQDFRNTINLHQNPAVINKTPIMNKNKFNPKEEPMTEVKRVPYRITDNEEGDMFENYSCSSDFEKCSPINAPKVGQGLLGESPKDPVGFNLNINNIQKSQRQERSTNSTKTIAQEILSSAAQKVGTTQNPTKEERIAQLQAAQALIQKQISELLEAEGQIQNEMPKKSSPKKQSPKKKNLKKSSKKEAVITTAKKPSISILPPTEKKELVSNVSPFRKERITEVTPQRDMDRREHLSQMKASLQIKQETVEKQLDSILGESPSPSKQVTRADWTVVSPVKFAIKPDQVNQQQAEQQYDLNIKVQPVEESSQEEISSHDLTEEEQLSDRLQQLKLFNEAERSYSHREHEQIEQSDEQTCAEIRLIFSPTKLEQCFVKQPDKNAMTQRLHGEIEKHEQSLASQQAESMSIREKLDMRLQQRLQNSKNNGDSSNNLQDSPCTRDRKYKQMQNDIFNKIQAQLKNM